MKSSCIRRSLTALTLSGLLALAACQTPPAVYELAEKSGSNAGVLQGHLAAVAAQSKTIASARADLIVSLEAHNARLAATLAREVYMQQHARPATEWAEIKALSGELTALRDDLVLIEAKSTILEADRRKELLATQTALNTYKAALRDTASALGSLAEKESASERAKFLAAFAREVRSDFKASLESNDATAQSASDLQAAIKAQLKATDPTNPSDPKN
ncbi:hypothetical protein [Polaromonas sp.]|uniref:hypothetical protein n=1 Tax=Polaromonas sp. TaxID=1869339 RepID=UPI003265A87A